MEDVLDSITNHLGFRQYITEAGEHVCPDCRTPYVNEGEGVICAECNLKPYKAPDAA